MKKIIYLLIAMFFINTSAIATPCPYNDIPCKKTYKEKKAIDKMFEERLNLTQEQIESVKAIRTKHRREMEKIISRMEFLHDKIRNVYLTGIPPFQADIRTVHYKAELVILKQSADRLRQETKKNFEAILTQEQKQEFNKMLQERAQKRANNKTAAN